MSSELDPIDVLVDMLGEEGFEIADTRLAAVVIVQRLRGSGFSVVPTEPPVVSDDVLLAGMQEVLRLRTEVDRLQEAKRRALQIADERAKEAVELRRRIAELGGRSGGGPETPPPIAPGTEATC
jgi:hypothetical protein